MKPGETLSLTLEFARCADAGDPYAFCFTPQDYLLRGAFGGFKSARLNWDAALLADLTAVRLPGRDPAAVQRLGAMLQHFLMPMGFTETESLLLAAVQEGRRVVLTLRSAAAELYALPWELMTLRTTGQHLGELPGVLLRYEWPETHSQKERAARPEGGRILLAWSAAAGAVPAAEQIAAIASACGAGSYPFSAESDVLPHASCGSLLQALAAAAREGRPIEVLHLLCHGCQTGSSFGLGLDGEEGESGLVAVDAGRLRQLLAPYAAMVRLVVLSACDSGDGGALGNQLGSVAQTLHRAGFPAVVASRYPLSVSGSIRLTSALYFELLARPDSLESALLVARQRLAEDATHLDWASLQLYARADDGDDTRPLLIRPYRGLLAFQIEHARFFFGREREVAQILEQLLRLQSSGRPRFLLVVGASGSGKSSVVLAGAVPRLLAASPRLRLLRMRPGSEPQKTLEAPRSSSACCLSERCGGRPMPNDSRPRSRSPRPWS